MQHRAISLGRLLKLAGDHHRVPVQMKSIRVAWISLRQPRSHFDALVEFAGDMAEVGRGDLDLFTLGDAVAQFVGPVDVQVA